MLDDFLKKIGLTATEISNLKEPPEGFTIDDLVTDVEKNIGDNYVKENGFVSKEKFDTAKIEGMKAIKREVNKHLGLGASGNEVEKMSQEDFAKKLTEFKEKHGDDKSADERVKQLQSELRKSQDLNAELTQELEKKTEENENNRNTYAKEFESKATQLLLKTHIAKHSANFQWGVNDHIKATMSDAAYQKIIQNNWKINEDGTLTGESGGRAQIGKQTFKTLEEFLDQDWSPASKQNNADPGRSKAVYSGIEIDEKQHGATNDLLARIEASKNS